MQLERERRNSVGKYASNKSTVSERINPIEQGASPESNIQREPRPVSDTVQELYDPTVAVTEQEVRRTVRSLVRRLPTTQQALLRSKISLPTQWARKLGLAPTAEVRMGWRLQRTLSQVSSPTSVVSTPQLPSGTQQFVIPSGESSDSSAPISRSQTPQPVESSVKGIQAANDSSVRQSPKRRLSNTQINRIIERQVSFFRSARVNHF